MPDFRIGLVLSFAFCASAGVQAEEVYKCTSAHGDIAYQDRPCAAGTNQIQVQIDAAPAPVSGPVDSVAPVPVAAAVPVAAPTPLPAVPALRKPLPKLWLCTRPEDGVQFVSRNGDTPPRLVPLGVMGYPGKSLASAYGPGGIGVSAPELSKTPVDTSSHASIASDYTEVQDQCVRANAEQSCNYLRKEYDRIHAKLRNAFKDEKTVLQPQEDQIEDELDGC